MAKEDISCIVIVVWLSLPRHQMKLFTLIVLQHCIWTLGEPYLTLISRIAWNSLSCYGLMKMIWKTIDSVVLGFWLLIVMMQKSHMRENINIHCRLVTLLLLFSFMNNTHDLLLKGREILAYICLPSPFSQGRYQLMHINFIEFIESFYTLYVGITTVVGGGTGPTDGSRATTCTPAPTQMKLMLQSTDDMPLNFGFTGKVCFLYSLLFHDFSWHIVNLSCFLLNVMWWNSRKPFFFF